MVMALRRDQQVSSNFDRLPPVLIARILQRVEQSERLSKCAPVCKCWAAAAAAATVSVDLTWPFDHQPQPDVEFFQRVTGLQPWLKQHSKPLVLLRLTPCRYYWGDMPQLELPCSLQQLSRLELAHITLNLPKDTPHQSSPGGTSTSSSHAVPTMLPKLVDLRLVACSISSTFLAQMLQLSGLTCLKLQKLYGTHGPFRKVEELGLFSTMLPRLPKLAHLELSHRGDYTPLAQMFPSNLTALGLQGGQLDLPCSLAQLVHLQKLDISEVKFNPAIISSMSKLLHLQLENVTLLPSGVGEGADSVVVLLAAVGGMRQLKHLSFVDDDIAWRSQSVQARHFSALTVSTHLTHLELHSETEQPLPPEAVQHMFPAGKQFPELNELAFWTFNTWSRCDEPGHITTAELRTIISACPSISSLDITCVLQPEADIQALLQLPPACRSLGIGGAGLSEEAAVIVAQLTQLTRLSWVHSPNLSDAGLDRLTALQALDVLMLRELDGLSDDLVHKHYGCMTDEWTLTAGDQPVWQQLHEKVRSVSGNTTWSYRLEVQEQQATSAVQEASTTKLKLDALSRYIDHALQVMMFCAGNAEVVQSVRNMADLGRKVLSGTAAAIGVSGAAGEGSGADGVGLGQQYRELQAPVKEFCRRSMEVMDALSCMEAAVLQAVEGTV